LIVVIFSLDFDFTHSLLMNRPVGWVYLTPLGAVSSTDRSDMVVPEKRLPIATIGKGINNFESAQEAFQAGFDKSLWRNPDIKFFSALVDSSRYSAGLVLPA
jgi:hypothetical protein